MPAGRSETRARKRIGRYVVTGRIGRGGMGVVYRGLDEALEREVAIKTLTAEGSLDAESRARFDLEAKAVARLQHPNIVTVFELGEDRGFPFIAMELLAGADLEALLRSGEALLLREKLEIVGEVCRGLAYAHEHGIVHRDVKPSNIRILDDGAVKIMDFGIAKLQGAGLTKAGMMVGTVHYMSPEQVRGRPLDGRSDVFSVGVILYELLAQRRPFAGEGPTEVLYKIVHENPDPLPLCEPGLAGAHLQQIVSRGLAKDPGARFPSAGALADALGQVLASLAAPAGAAAAGQAVEAQALGLSRRLLREGRVEESLRTLQELASRAPESLEVRRALRAAGREMQRRRERREEPDADEFPELEVTYQVPPTHLQPGTVAAAVPRPRRGPWPAIAAAMGGGAAVLVAVPWLLRPASPPAAPAAPAVQRVPVRSQPAGAAVWVDGVDSGVVTDGEVVLPADRTGALRLSFRIPGRGEESRTVTLPLPAGQPVSVAFPEAPPQASVGLVSDPAGAAVSVDGRRLAETTPVRLSLDPRLEHRVSVALAGYATRELKLPAGGLPAELRVALEPASPPGALTVRSAYPLDVVWRGKTVARGEVSPRISLAQGRQALTLVSSAVFLRTTLDVEVGADSAVAAPPTGTINVKATPDNCEVLIDGFSAGYLPIRDAAIAAGPHRVTFQWPDGGRREEAVHVTPGRPTYVMARKD